jgi:hypothetical protein
LVGEGKHTSPDFPRTNLKVAAIAIAIDLWAALSFVHAGT